MVTTALIVAADSAADPPFNVTARSTPPTNPTIEDIYLDDGTNTTSGDPGWRRYNGTAWEDVSAGAGGGGEVNTASNIGVGGVGFFDAKVGIDLQFRNAIAGSSKLTVTDVPANDEVAFDVSEANLTLDNLGGTLGIAKGGTGQTAQTAAMDALSPTTTKGDILVDDGTNVTRLPVGTNSQVLSANSAQASGLEWVAASGGGIQSIITVMHRQAAGTAGGNTSSGVNTLTLNYLHNPDSVAGVSLGSNQLTLPAGTYSLPYFGAYSFQHGISQLYIYNATDAANLSDGTKDVIAINFRHANGDTVSLQPHGAGQVFTLASAKALELRMDVTIGTTDGQGTAKNSGREEVYAIMAFKKIG